MAKKKDKIKLEIRGILGIACVAIWLICAYGQIKEDVGDDIIIKNELNTITLKLFLNPFPACTIF